VEHDFVNNRHVPKRRPISIYLYGGISQKMELSRTTAVVPGSGSNATLRHDRRAQHVGTDVCPCYREIQEGVPVSDINGNKLGDSKIAAQRGIALVTFSRIGMAAPGMGEYQGTSPLAARSSPQDDISVASRIEHVHYVRELLVSFCTSHVRQRKLQWDLRRVWLQMAALNSLLNTERAKCTIPKCMSGHQYRVQAASAGIQHVCILKKVKIKVILRPTVTRPVRLCVRHPSGTRDQFFPFSL
jgi:hypothetical protein